MILKREQYILHVKQGMSLSEVAKKFNVSRAAIYNAVKYKISIKGHRK